MTSNAERLAPSAPNGRVQWIVVLLSASGVELLPGQRLQLQQLPSDRERVDVALATRFEDAGLTDFVPQELVLEVYVHAEDVDDAVAQAASVANGITAMLSFAVNSYVAPAEPHLAYESAPGLSRRRFWQRDIPLQHGVPRPSRQLDYKLLEPLLTAFFQSTEVSRLARAVSQYHVALRYWTTAGQPLALAHLYMALETLAPAAERAERARLGLADDREHARHRDVDVTRSNWKDVLLGWVRRDVICQGDKATYDAARKASDGFEHGSMALPQFRAAAAQHGRALLHYVRSGLLYLLDLPPAVRDELAAKRPLDISSLWQEVRGELTGNVEDPHRLGHDGEPYPYVDWQNTLDDARRLPDGRLQLKSRITLTARLAEGVHLAPSSHRIGVGLTDADLVSFEPGTEEPTIIRRSVHPGTPQDQPDPAE